MVVTTQNGPRVHNERFSIEPDKGIFQKIAEKISWIWNTIVKGLVAAVTQANFIVFRGLEFIFPDSKLLQRIENLGLRSVLFFRDIDQKKLEESNQILQQQVQTFKTSAVQEHKLAMQVNGENKRLLHDNKGLNLEITALKKEKALDAQEKESLEKTVAYLTRSLAAAQQNLALQEGIIATLNGEIAALRPQSTTSFEGSDSIAALQGTLSKETQNWLLEFTTREQQV